MTHLQSVASDIILRFNYIYLQYMCISAFFLTQKPKKLKYQVSLVLWSDLKYSYLGSKTVNNNTFSS